MVVLILTKSNKGDAFIEGLDKLNGGVIEECEYKELKMKLRSTDTDFPDRYSCGKTRKVTDLLTILTDHHFDIVSQFGTGTGGGCGGFVSWTLTRRFFTHD